MKRKIIQLGGSTLVVSLPSKWVRTANLKPGDEISLDQVPGGLLVAIDTPLQIRETEVALTHLTESSIRVRLNNAYRAGFDRIKINFTSQRQFDILKEIMQTKLVGFEIVEQSETNCTIENITEPSKDQFEKIFRKELFAINELLNITHEYMQSGTKSAEFKDLEATIQRYDNFCRRVIAKQLFSDGKSEFLWTFLSTISHAQREIYHACKALRKPTSKDLIELIVEVKNAFEVLKNAYIEKDVASLAELHDTNQRVFHDLGYSLIKKTQGDEAVVLHHLLSGFRQFYTATSPLTGLLT